MSRTLEIKLTVTIDDDADDLEQARETADRIIGCLFPSGEFGGVADLEALTVDEVPGESGRLVDVLAPDEGPQNSPLSAAEQEQPRERTSGRYAPSGLDSRCRCGHILGRHDAERREWDGATWQECHENCSCTKFERAKAENLSRAVSPCTFCDSHFCGGDCED